jgi:hypothetical protein
MKTFSKFKSDATELNERFLTRAECIQAYHEGIKDGTIDPAWALTVKATKSGLTKDHIAAGNAHMFAALKHKEGSPEREQHTDHANNHYGLIGGLTEDDIEEDSPTNNAGSGNVAGIGVGPQGEPGVDPIFQRIRKQVEVVGPKPVDPLMFADKIFGHSATAPQPKKVAESMTPETAKSILAARHNHASWDIRDAENCLRALKKQKPLKGEGLTKKGFKQAAVPDSKGNRRKIK